MIFEQKRTASVRAVTFSEVMVLTKVSILIHIFPPSIKDTWWALFVSCSVSHPAAYQILCLRHLMIYYKYTCIRSFQPDFDAVVSQYPDVQRMMKMEATMRRNARSMQTKERDRQRNGSTRNLLAGVNNGKTLPRPPVPAASSTPPSTAGGVGSGPASPRDPNSEVSDSDDGSLTPGRQTNSGQISRAGTPTGAPVKTPFAINVSQAASDANRSPSPTAAAAQESSSQNSEAGDPPRRLSTGLEKWRRLRLLTRGM